MDPGHKARKNPSDNADLGFSNRRSGSVHHAAQRRWVVDGLSAAKRHIIQSLAEIHHIDVICLQEAHVNTSPTGTDTARHTRHRHGTQVRPPHNLRFRHQQLHTPCQTWTCDIMFAVTSLMLRVCRRLRAATSFVWADITLPTSTNHQLNIGTTQICHQSFLILQSWLETLTAIIRTGDIRRLI